MQGGNTFTEMHHQFWKPFYILRFLSTFVNNEWALNCDPPAGYQGYTRSLGKPATAADLNSSHTETSMLPFHFVSEASKRMIQWIEILH